MTTSLLLHFQMSKIQLTYFHLSQLVGDLSLPKPGLNVPGAMPVVCIIVLYLHDDTLNDTHKRFTSVGFHVIHISGLCQPSLSMEKAQTGYSQYWACIRLNLHIVHGWWSLLRLSCEGCWKVETQMLLATNLFLLPPGFPGGKKPPGFQGRMYQDFRESTAQSRNNL